MTLEWAQIIGNVASGGVLGLLGTTVGEVIGFFRRKQEHTQAIERARLDAEIATAKTAGEVAVARERGAADAFTASQQSEGNLKGEHRWATTFRAITRPGLTWLTGIASVGFAFFPPTSEAGQLLAMSVNAHFGMMSAWWFGQRALDRQTTTWSGGTITGKVGGK